MLISGCHPRIPLTPGRAATAVSNTCKGSWLPGWHRVPPKLAAVPSLRVWLFSWLDCHGCPFWGEPGCVPKSFLHLLESRAPRDLPLWGRNGTPVPAQPSPARGCRVSALTLLGGALTPCLACSPVHVGPRGSEDLCLGTHALAREQQGSSVLSWRPTALLFQQPEATTDLVRLLFSKPLGHARSGEMQFLRQFFGQCIPCCKD